MNIFIGRTEDKLAIANFLGHLIQALADGFSVFFADNALTTEHSGVRLRSLDIKGAVALFDHDGGIKIFHQLICRQIKATATRFAIHL